MHRPALLILSTILLTYCQLQVVAVKPSLPGFLKFNPAEDQKLRRLMPDGYQVVEKTIKGDYCIKTTRGTKQTWPLDFHVTHSRQQWCNVQDKEKSGQKRAIRLSKMGSEQECEKEAPLFEPPVDGIVNLLAWDYQQGFCIQVFSEEHNYPLTSSVDPLFPVDQVQNCVNTIAKGLNNLLDRGYFIPDFNSVRLRMDGAQLYTHNYKPLKCAIDPSPDGRFQAQMLPQDLNQAAYFSDFMTKALRVIMGLEYAMNFEWFVSDAIPVRIKRFDAAFQNVIKALVATPGSPDFVDFQTLLAKFGISLAVNNPKSARKV